MDELPIIILNTIAKYIENDIDKIKLKKKNRNIKVILNDYYNDDTKLEYLKLGCYFRRFGKFNQKFKDYEHLIYGYAINTKTLNEYIPYNTKYLTIIADYGPKIIINKTINIPKNITHISVPHSYYSSANVIIDYLPEQITHLYLGFQFDRSVDNLPKSLTHLELGYYFNQPIDNLPSNLTHLTIDNYLPKEFLEGIVSFCGEYEDGYESRFNQPIDNLPPNLTHLSISACFDYPINNLPSTLTHLTICGNFNQPIDNLPKNLIYLKIYGLFNQPINNLPPNLKYLEITGNFQKNINDYILPTNLEKIIIEYHASTFSDY